jgi:hypothetical protein
MSLAVTAKYGPALFTVIAVSKAATCWEPAFFSAAAELPASTVQLASSVEPF